MGSIIEDAKKVLLKDMIESVQPNNKWKLLIVDEISVSVINAACSMYDIMEHDITTVEPINVKRQPLRNFEAIYFITPKESSVKLMIEDFSQKTPKYAALHIFFTSKVSKELLSMIMESKARSHIKTVKVLNLEFISKERQLVTLKMPQSLRVLYGRNQADPKQMLSEIAGKLVTLCATLGEYPNIIFDSESRALQLLAADLQRQLDDLCRETPNFPPSSNRGRGTVLLVDRSLDVLAPLLHEYTYQAMCYDLLSIDGDKYSFWFQNNAGVDSKKTVLLNESDRLWPRLRHIHIAIAVDDILASFNEFVKSSSASKLKKGSGKINSLKEMSEIMREMPEYQSLLGKYSQHITMAAECLSLFKKRNMTDLSLLEQDMACGANSEGNEVHDISARLTGFLQEPERSLEDKLRLLMIYIVSQKEGIKDADKNALLDVAELAPDDIQTITNLSLLGVKLTRGSEVKRRKSRRERGRDQAANEDVPFEISRYSTALKELLKSLSNGSLSHDKRWQYTKPPSTIETEETREPRAGRKVPKWADHGSKKAEETKGQSRTIIFMLGGATYSESRAVYEVSRDVNKDILLATTDMLTPKEFLVELKEMQKI